MTHHPRDAVRPIPPGEERGWRIRVQDEPGGPWREIEPAVLQAEQARLGLSISYGAGAAPERFDRFVLRERGGGGVVIVPHAVIAGEPYVGVIRQYRALAGQRSYGLPMGGVHPGEERLEAARRELTEETGLDEPLSQRVSSLPGRPLNPSPGFFQADFRRGEGATFFQLPFSADELTPRRVSSNPLSSVYELRARPARYETPPHDGEVIDALGLRFFHADLLVCCLSDAFSLVGIARLISALPRG